VGTVFQVTPGGTITTLYSFCAQANCTDGSAPYAGLVQATNGNLYGTTEAGGANGKGTVFEITLGGTLTTLHSFCSQANCADGSLPRAGLIQATNGNFYGTTFNGGALGVGSVFSITTTGKLTTLYSGGPYTSAKKAKPLQGRPQWAGSQGSHPLRPRRSFFP